MAFSSLLLFQNRRFTDAKQERVDMRQEALATVTSETSVFVFCARQAAICICSGQLSSHRFANRSCHCHTAATHRLFGRELVLPTARLTIRLRKLNILPIKRCGNEHCDADGRRQSAAPYAR